MKTLFRASRVHISETGRFIPTEGGMNRPETFAALKSVKYNEQLTIGS
ncbi:MAG: hypothetical protein ACKO2P_10105 [Planctomycetota bacterium]